jgi:mRNA interferase HigB
MRVIALSRLRAFWEEHADAEEPLKAWNAEARDAAWKNPAELKAQFASASIVGDSRVVFNIAGNKFRLVVSINYAAGIIFIKFVGTHAEYDKIDVRTIQPPSK